MDKVHDSTLKVRKYSARSTAILTLVTFSLALVAIPISGSNCPVDCIEYPYLEASGQYPRDFLWMYAAMLMMISYLIMMISSGTAAPNNRKIFGQIGVTLSAIATTVLLFAYYSQVSIIPISLLSSESEGIPLLIQYNPHGLFIALEELGFVLMSLSFVAIAAVFSGQTKREVWIKRIFVLAFILGVVAMIVISTLYGLDKQDRFEVFIISINWLALIVNGILIGGLNHEL